MKHSLNKKLIILIVIFLCTTALVYGIKQPAATKETPPLNAHLLNIPGYRMVRTIELSKNARDMLHLDDYLFADFKGPDNNTINLYIGLYYSGDRAYASHSPTVCYPSQGWKITSKPRKYSLETPSGTIHYQELTTELGEQKELVLYWYQSRLLTATQIYKNKINMGYNKLAHNDQQHSFVRVAVPFGNSSPEQAKKTATGFIQSFYPEFTQYLLD